MIYRQMNKKSWDWGYSSMENPQFNILRFGPFEYKMQKEDKKKERLIVAYEFEFYTDDCSGGLCHGEHFYPARRGGCTLFRPGQNQSTVRPYKGYFLNLTTADPELCEFLNSLPQFFVLWDIAEVVELVKRMVAVENRDSLSGRLELQSCVCKILALLYPYRKMPKDVDSSTLQHQKKLLFADRYIRGHLSDELTLKVLAAQCNLDPTYFHKLFTAAFGKTPAQRVLDYRIAVAKTGLLENKVSLNELATRCGFSSQTYFCYKFKQVTGKTPLQYRADVLSYAKK